MPKWLLYSILTVLFWGAWGAVSRVLGDSLPGAQSQVISTLGLLPILIILTSAGHVTAGSVRGCALAFVAGLVGGLGNIAFYHLMSLGEKAVAIVPLTALYPLVTVALALVLLKERINRVQSAGVVLALLAMYLFNAGSSGPVKAGVFLQALLSIALWGMAGFIQKLSTSHVSGEVSAFWFLLAMVPVAVILPLVQRFAWRLPVVTWGWAIVLGLCFGLGNLTLLAAFASGGKASLVAPFCGLYPLVTVPLAVLFLGERVTLREWTALAVAMAAVAALAFETQPASPKSPSAEPEGAALNRDGPRQNPGNAVSQQRPKSD